MFHGVFLVVYPPPITLLLSLGVLHASDSGSLLIRKTVFDRGKHYFRIGWPWVTRMKNCLLHSFMSKTRKLSKITTLQKPLLRSFPANHKVCLIRKSDLHGMKSEKEVLSPVKHFTTEYKEKSKKKNLQADDVCTLYCGSICPSGGEACLLHSLSP